MKQVDVICNEIELNSSIGYGRELICPRCAAAYLHSGRVTVYDRGEDEKVTSVSIVGCGLTATHLMASRDAGNPSMRRHGIAIAFECEGCEGPLELTFAQHKGTTYLAWRFTALRLPTRWGDVLPKASA